nr:MAG TPA: late genes activator [Caudoviricetes sp.]
MITRRGIYYDLNDTTYIFKVEGLTFYFSSEFYKTKFFKTYKNYVKTENLKLSVNYNCNINATIMLLLKLYQKIETRGFKVEYEGKHIEEINLIVNIER